MFRRGSDDNEMREIFYSRIFSGNISNIEELQLRLRRYFERHLESQESDDESQSETNPNFIQEKDINYRKYPLYINWKRVEANELGYYRVFARYGYFGVSVYSSFKELHPDLNVDNILFCLAKIVSEYLFSKEIKSESVQKSIKNIFEKIPKLNDIFDLIRNKILLLKEIPVIFLILKIYEVYFLINKNNNELKNTLEYMYMLGNYLTDQEFKDLYINHYKGKISKIFKTVSANGKEYGLQKTKQKLFAHIKLVYENNK